VRLAFFLGPKKPSMSWCRTPRMPALRVLTAAAATGSSTLLATLLCDSQQPLKGSAPVGLAPQAFWVSRWQSGKTGWRLAQPHHFLVKHHTQLLHANDKQRGKLRVLGKHAQWTGTLVTLLLLLLWTGVTKYGM
jgi:hypothetical protein